MLNRTVTARAAALALSAGLALSALTGCGDDSSESESAAGSSSSSAPSSAPATAPADPAAAEEEVGENYRVFFEDGDPTLLEDGEELTEAIAALGALAPPPRTKSANVTVVEFTGPDTANVTYDLIVDGEPALPGATGEAVLVDGVWKVSKNTFCTLSTLASGSPAEGCS